MTTTRVIDGVIYEFEPGTPESVIKRVENQAKAKAAPAVDAEGRMTLDVTTRDPEARKPEPPRAQPALTGAPGALLQGLSLGFSDEAIAGLRSAMGQGSYEDLVKAEREALRKYGEEYPVRSTAAEIAGGVLPALVTGGAGLIPGVSKAATSTLGPRTAALLTGSKPTLARTTGIGGGMGATQAVGTSEKPLAELPGEAFSGAVAGSTTTLGLGLLGKYVALPAFSAAKRSLGFGDENKMADLAIAQALAKDGYTPEQAQKLLQGMARGEMTLADVGENTANLLRKASSAPGPARAATKSALVGREVGRPDRISDDLRTLMSASPDFYTDVQDLMRRRSMQADALYKTAYRQATTINPQTAPNIAAMTDRPSFKAALAQGMKRMQDKGIDPTKPRHVLEGLHETKRALDDMIEAAVRAGENAQAGTLIDMKKALLKDMERVSPAYRSARLAYAGDSEMIKAMNEGKKIYALPEPELRKLEAEFRRNPSEYDAFRAGIAQAMLEKVQAAGPGKDPMQVIFPRAGASEERLRRAFRDDQAFNEFKRRLLEEARMLGTERSGFRKTVQDADLDERAPGVGAARALLSGAPVTAGIEAVRNMFPNAMGMPQRVAIPTTQKLLSPTTNVDAVINDVLQSLKAEEAALVRQSGLANIGAASVGQQAGGREPKPQYPEGRGAPPMPPGASPLGQMR